MSTNHLYIFCVILNLELLLEGFLGYSPFLYSLTFLHLTFFVMLRQTLHTKLAIIMIISFLLRLKQIQRKINKNCPSFIAFIYVFLCSSYRQKILLFHMWMVVDNTDSTIIKKSYKKLLLIEDFVQQMYL